MRKKHKLAMFLGLLLAAAPLAHATQARYNQLLEEIERYNRLYFQEQQPIISDREYDDLLEELLRIEKEHPEWVRPSSPSQRVGSDLDPEKPASAHLTPMLSIESTRSKSDLRQFWQRVAKEIGAPVDYVVEEKIDGVAVSLQYAHGQLLRALTRGDGTNGNDITAHVLHIQGIPVTLNGNGPAPDIVEIRGEIYIPKTLFPALRRQDKKPYANPRNAAAGVLNTKYPLKEKLLQLRMIPHSIGFGREIAATQTELLRLFEQFGFTEKIRQIPCKSLPEIEDALSSIERDKDKLPYEIDGAVVKVNDLRLQQKLGRTLKAPRDMLAYKFNYESAWTRVINIIESKGPKGKITPVAIVAPVRLDGTTVKRVSLHNHDILEELDIQSGDEVRIEKSGKIIPKVIAVRRASEK